ncbi:xanthine/uracil permease family protein, putative [Medicago truncatula]|uniref:Xanthine/uracil permease family protein, putative n=1 Tax=Medicago truncatula TaxID=3880 RepID=G7JUV3_MEDTR|nr:xanthine/uracil permease family protein, putative [Medicago truncatula]
MRKLLELDGIKAEGEAKLQRKAEFKTFRAYNMNEEFYSLPFNLNRFFPPS